MRRTSVAAADDCDHLLLPREEHLSPLNPLLGNSNLSLLPPFLPTLLPFRAILFLIRGQNCFGKRSIDGVG